MCGALPAKGARQYDMRTFWQLTKCREYAALAKLRLALAHTLEDAMLADRAGRMLDKEKIARARLQCALKSAFLRVSAHLFAALLLAVGRLGGRLPMRVLALTRAEAAVADALKLLVRVLGGACRLIVL